MNALCRLWMISSFVFFVTWSNGQAGDFSLGVDVNFPPAFWLLGSTTPAGAISASVGHTTSAMGQRVMIGTLFPSGLNVALEIESREIFAAKFGSGWVYPVLGVALNWQRKYQVMAPSDSSKSTENEHFDPYYVGTNVQVWRTFVGVRSYFPFSERLLLTSPIGVIYRLALTGGRIRTEYIRNCYVDKCSDSDESGGGEHPVPILWGYWSIGIDYVL